MGILGTRRIDRKNYPSDLQRFFERLEVVFDVAAKEYERADSLTEVSRRTGPLRGNAVKLAARVKLAASLQAIAAELRK